MDTTLVNTKKFELLKKIANLSAKVLITDNDITHRILAATNEYCKFSSDETFNELLLEMENCSNLLVVQCDARQLLIKLLVANGNLSMLTTKSESATVETLEERPKEVQQILQSNQNKNDCNVVPIFPKK